MAFNRLFLKVISIIQIVMTAVFLVLAMVDRYKVLPAGIMGLFLAKSSRPSSTLVSAQSSVSLACAVVSAVTVYRYGWAINNLLASNLFNQAFEAYPYTTSHFTDKDVKPELTEHEKTMLAISLLVVVFSIIEIALAVGGARSSDSFYQTPQANQPSNAYNQLDQFGAGQIPLQLQPTYITPQPMVPVAIPVSTYNA